MIFSFPLDLYQVAAAAMEVGARQGKTPILVKDVPGMWMNSKQIEDLRREKTNIKYDGDNKYIFTQQYILPPIFFQFKFLILICIYIYFHFS